MPTPREPRIVLFIAIVVSLAAFLASVLYHVAGHEARGFDLEPLAPQQPGRQPQRRVFLLGIDGIGNLPKFHHFDTIGRIISEGASCLNVVSVLPSFSVECWTSMLHGVTPKHHNFSTDKYMRHELGKFPQDSPYPSILMLVGRNGFASVSVSHWRTITNLLIEDDIPHCLKITAKTTDDVFRHFEKSVSDGASAFVFVDFDECDVVGHREGYFTDSHVQCLRRIDTFLEKMMNIIDRLPGENYVMVTSDHGGGGVNLRQHGTDHPQDLTVFWALRGPGIPHLVIDQMSLVDIPFIAAKLLKLETPPAWEGRVPAPLVIP